MKNGDAVNYHTADGDYPGRILELEAPQGPQVIATIAARDPGGHWTIVRCELGTNHGMFELA